MLALPRNRSVTSEEIERVIGREFSDGQFAALGNELLMTTTGRQPASMLAISEHARRRSDGIDPDWQVEVFGSCRDCLPLLHSGLNVFESRRRTGAEESAERNARAFTELVAQARGAANSIFYRTQYRPEHYVLITNLRLNTPDSDGASSRRRQLERSILLGIDRTLDVQVSVLAAEDLAARINRLPFLRAAWFDLESPALQPASVYGSWRAAWRSYTSPHLFGIHADLVGREGELAELRSVLNDPAVRLVTLSGPQDVGKTRLALEATARWSRETIVAFDARFLTPDRVERLATPGKEVIVVARDCETALAGQLARHFCGAGCPTASAGLKLLLTMSPDSAPPAVGYQNGAIRNLYLKPLSDPQARLLLDTAVPGLDREAESWIVREAQGIPGIVLMAAGLRQRLRTTGPAIHAAGSAGGAPQSALTAALLQGMKNKIRSEFGEHGYRIIRLLSLMTRTQVRRPASGIWDLDTLCRLYGDGLEPQAVLNTLPRCRNAGILRAAGDLARVVPGFLANDLALEAILEHPEHLSPLINTMIGTGRLRVLRAFRSIGVQPNSRPGRAEATARVAVPA